MAGVKDVDGKVVQSIPSLKEVEAQPIMGKTQIVYLDLIPGKPDTLVTLLYTISLIREMFIEKLGYRQVMLCGDGKTVNLLYKIR